MRPHTAPRMTATTAPDQNDDQDDDPWRQVAFFLRHALSLFGDPAALAQKLWLSARDHKQFADYVRAVEAMVRRLIFIAALELSPITLPPTPERKYRARLALPTNAGASFDATKPETWRVSFKLASERRGPRRHLAVTPNHAGEGVGASSDPRIPSAPSAERLEALIRAYENRDKLAAALARKLARDAEAARAYVTRPRRKRTRGPVYIDPFKFLDLAIDTYERFVQRTALALNSS